MKRIDLAAVALSLRKTIERSLRRFVGFLARTVERGAIATRLRPSLTGYRYLPVEPLLGYAQRDGTGAVREVYVEEREGVGLPCNVTDVGLLPSDRGRWNRSFADIPGRTRRGVSLVDLTDCRILAARGEWELSHFAVLTPEGRRIKMPGTRWLPEHRQLLRNSAPQQKVDHAVWVQGSWHLNYFHWLLQIVTKLSVLNQEGLAERLILGPDFHAPPVWHESAAAVGIDLATVPLMQGPVLAARKLTIVYSPDLNGKMLRDFRDSISAERTAAPWRKLFITRQNAKYRRLENEPEILGALESHGFEVVSPEKLSFLEQVKLFSEAESVVGLHGAGLANIVFTQTNANVVEIIDPAFPNPEYYELASLMGHRYWLCEGTPVGEFRPGYHDLRLDVGAIQEVLAEFSGL